MIEMQSNARQVIKLGTAQRLALRWASTAVNLPQKICLQFVDTARMWGHWHMTQMPVSDDASDIAGVALLGRDNTRSTAGGSTCFLVFCHNECLASSGFRTITGKLSDCAWRMTQFLIDRARVTRLVTRNLQPRKPIISSTILVQSREKRRQDTIASVKAKVCNHDMLIVC